MPMFGRGRPIQPVSRGAVRVTATGGLLDASASFVGTSSLTAAAVLVLAASASVAAQGTVSAAATQVLRASASITGVLSLSATPEGGDVVAEPTTPPGMPGGRIIPWDRVPQPRARGRTLADEKRELAKLFGPKAKKKRKPDPEPPPPDPIPYTAPALPAPEPEPTKRGLVELLDAMNQPGITPPARLRITEPEDPAPVALDASVADRMAWSAREDDELMMLLALVTTLEDA